MRTLCILRILINVLVFSTVFDYKIYCLIKVVLSTVFVSCLAIIYTLQKKWYRIPLFFVQAVNYIHIINARIICILSLLIASFVKSGTEYQIMSYYIYKEVLLPERIKKYIKVVSNTNFI